MGKAKTERRLKDNEAQAVARTLRVSPQKLNLVAALIRGKKVMLGALDVASAHVETPEEVAAVLRRALPFVDADKLMTVLATTNLKGIGISDIVNLVRLAVAIFIAIRK